MSLRPPPRNFRLLRLPRLALTEVVKCWNPIEIYLFSRVSRKTKQISKLVKKTHLKLSLCVSKYYEVRLGYPLSSLSTYWCFRLYPGLRNYEKYKRERLLVIHSKNAGKSIGKLVDHCMEIFKCEIGSLRVNINPVMKSSYLNIFMKWLNQNEKISKIPYVIAYSEEEEDQFYLKWFMQNFKKDVGVMNLNENYYAPEWAELKVNRKVDDLSLNSRSKWINIDQLISMDCILMHVGETSLTNQDLNVFMKNWKEMRTNERVKFYFLGAKEKLDWRVILDGLDGEIRDVRTVRRDYKSPWTNKQAFKYYGGVDITRRDGKMATIGMIFHMIYDKEPLSRQTIRDYQKLIVGQNMDGQEMDINFRNDPEYKLTVDCRKAFFIVVW